MSRSNCNETRHWSTSIPSCRCAVVCQKHVDIEGKRSCQNYSWFFCFLSLPIRFSIHGPLVWRCRRAVLLLFHRQTTRLAAFLAAQSLTTDLPQQVWAGVNSERFLRQLYFLSGIQTVFHVGKGHSTPLTSAVRPPGSVSPPPPPPPFGLSWWNHLLTLLTLPSLVYCGHSGQILPISLQEGIVFSYE